MRKSKISNIAVLGFVLSCVTGLSSSSAFSAQEKPTLIRPQVQTAAKTELESSVTNLELTWRITEQAHPHGPVTKHEIKSLHLSVYPKMIEVRVHDKLQDKHASKQLTGEEAEKLVTLFNKENWFDDDGATCPMGSAQISIAFNQWVKDKEGTYNRTATYRYDSLACPKKFHGNLDEVVQFLMDLASHIQ
jgi:hypothetical protein